MTRASGFTLCLVGAITAEGCLAPPPPVLAPMPGCYAVSANSWSSGHAAATGVKELPPVIGIDSNVLRAVLVPPQWRLQIPEYTNTATWSDYSFDWLQRGDTIVETFSGKEHRMAADSMLLRVRGWAGMATAFLARTPDGFEGLVQMTSRSQTTLPRARLTLTRTDCAGRQLVSSGPVTSER